MTKVIKHFGTGIHIEDEESGYLILFKQQPIMTTTEIKKELYKQKPLATVDFERGDFIHFSTIIIVDNTEEIIRFEVPMSEDPKVNEVPAQLLIRWLVTD